jgi:hypothetical protein
VDVACKVVEDLPDDVFGLGGTAGAGKPGELRRNAVIERSPGPQGSFLRGSKYLRELRSDIGHCIIVGGNIG